MNRTELCVLSLAVFSVLLIYWCKMYILQKVLQVLKAEQEGIRQDTVIDDETPVAGRAQGKG